MSNRPNLKSVNILVVDDDPLLGNLITRWIMREGFGCVRAANANEAWASLQRISFDLVTLDIRMPGESGLQLLQRIKKQFPDIEVLMLTGEGDIAAAIEALTTGAFGYLQKPALREQIIEQIRQGLEHRRTIIENRQHEEFLTATIREQSTAIASVHNEAIKTLVRASLYRDEETGAHIQRTGEFSWQIATQMGWQPDMATRIRQAAPLHDVGKIGIPDAILRKPGKLTLDEMSIMRTHTNIGAGMLADSQSPMLRMARDIALCHHERWDGEGYPNRIHGDEIPVAARIVAVADVFDALSHDRVYRPALAEQDVLAILRDGRGREFDPEILDVFFDILPQIRHVNKTLVDDQSSDNGFHRSGELAGFRGYLDSNAVGDFSDPNLGAVSIQGTPVAHA